MQSRPAPLSMMGGDKILWKKWGAESYKQDVGVYTQWLMAQEHTKGLGGGQCECVCIRSVYTQVQQKLPQKHKGNTQRDEKNQMARKQSNSKDLPKM